MLWIICPRRISQDYVCYGWSVHGGLVKNMYVMDDLSKEDLSRLCMLWIVCAWMIWSRLCMLWMICTWRISQKYVCYGWSVHGGLVKNMIMYVMDDVEDKVYNKICPIVHGWMPWRIHTATKIHLCIPRKGIARPQSLFLHLHSCVFERFVYSQDLYLSQIHKCRNWETEHYNSVLEITRLHSFISGNTWMGTRHLYWILTGPSFAVHPRFHLTPTSCEIMHFYVLWKFQ
jgi:hypothetical protein